MRTDFELEQYLQELYHEINSLVYTDEFGDTKENKFTEYVMELLSESGETESNRLCRYVKENKQEIIQYKINGYGIEEGYETLNIFITHYQDTNQIYKLAKPDFEKLLKWPVGFLNAAFKRHLDEIEPSIEAYGLARLISDHYKEFDRVNIFIISNGIINYEPPNDFTLKGLEDTSFLFHVWDVDRLHRLSQSKYNREPIEIDFRNTFGEVIPCLSMPSSNELYECYLAILPGRLLSTLYKNYGTRLLESNVRAFLQQTGKINKGIRDTIREQPYMFLPYNNGLATTAQEIKTEKTADGQLVITGVRDFQIVNGGQTTASLFHTEKKHKADLSQVFVQMKLTVIKDEDKKNETVPYISRYANSQNTITELDLTSNSPFLQRLEELSRTTYAIDPFNPSNQTIWFLERVKGQYKEALNKEPTKSQRDAFMHRYPRNQIIVKSEIAKYMNVWHLQPYHVAKGAQKNYTHFLKDIDKEFKTKKPSRFYWQDVVANAILFRNADELFGRKNQDAIGDTNIKSQTVAYALSYLHYLTKNKLNLQLIWETQKVPEDLLREIKKGMVFIYVFFKTLDVALISEATKNEKTWKSLIQKSQQPMNLNVLNKYILNDLDLANRYEADIHDTAKTKKYDDQNKIISLGVRFWDGLDKYNYNNKILSKNQDNVVFSIKKSLKDGLPIYDSQIKKGIEIIDLLLKSDIDFEEIISLSNLDDKKLIESSIIYNRLKRISTSDWSRIISLGEYRNILKPNEISVLKSVIQRLKRNENIDFNRLQIAQIAIDKMKRFGINV
jgi:hypothetical protein